MFMTNLNQRFATSLLTGLLLVPALYGAAALAQEPPAGAPDVEQVVSSKLARITENLAKEQRQAQLAIERERAALNALELNTDRQSISAGQLEQARLDAAAMRSQRNNLGSRLLSRRDTLHDIDADIERLSDRLNNGGKASLLEPQIAALQQERAEVDIVVDSLIKLQRMLDTRWWLARQQLSVLQNRFELPDLSSMTRPPSPQEQQLRNDMDGLLAKASELRISASDIAEQLAERRSVGSPTDNSLELHDQQRWLALQAQAAEERAELRQQTLKLLRAEQVLRVLSTFPQAQSTPLRVLESGSDNMLQLQKNPHVQP